MIKHRFILRDVSDFKVFAAIPVEASLLTWKKWTRPPDWEAFRELVQEAADATLSARAAFLAFGRAAQELRASAVRCLEAGEDEGVAQLARRMRDHIEWAMIAEARVDKSAQELLNAAVVLPPPEAERTSDLFLRAIETLAPLLAQDVDPDHAVANLRAGYDGHLDVLSKPHKPLREETRELVKKMRSTFDVFVERLTDIEKSMDRRKAVAVALKELLSSDPLPTTPCPPGLPFAAYTVEWHDVIVNVVEGRAWVHARRVSDAAVEGMKRGLAKAVDGLSMKERQNLAAAMTIGLEAAEFYATDDEKRVVEIVSQMLTERSLNPKADTKIPVREIDPAKAHQAREADCRDTARQHATVRTIKFEVTPPRYLREAAEHILASPRKAHWVIGHWRNQPYGEKRTLHRQQWIKPHIRGLGEASATTARVVAPHARPAT